METQRHRTRAQAEQAALPATAPTVARQRNPHTAQVSHFGNSTDVDGLDGK
jgi:hypothetical protein